MTYRNLEDNEVIQAGDEFHAKHDMEDCWDTVQGSIGSTPAQFTELKCEGMKWRRPIKTGFISRGDLDARIDAGILAKYNELILAVAQVFPGETRHQTALRYIREREEQSTKAGKPEEKPR